MTQVKLSPTVALTPLAAKRLNELSFGPEGPLLPMTETFEKRDLNFFGRFVKRVNQTESFLAGITKLVVTILLALSIIGIPLLYLEARELNMQKEELKKEEDVIEKLNLRNRKINQRTYVVEQMNLQNFTAIPVLDVKDLEGQTGFIDYLSISDLSSSIMKGTDKNGRAFISLKLKRPKDGPHAVNQSGSTIRQAMLAFLQANEFVVTLFERSQGADFWSPATNVSVPELMGPINDASLAIFHQILEGNHPQFKLV